MTSPPKVWLDGDKIPRQWVERLFVGPPDLDLPPRRSTLLVGTKGAGKTILLKHLAAMHEAAGNRCLFIDLYGSLSYICRDAGVGPWDREVSGTLADQIQGKVSADLGTHIVTEADRMGVNLEKGLVEACLPGKIMDMMPRNPATLRRAVADTPLDTFGNLHKLLPLRQLLSGFSKAVSEQLGKELLVLLDRADMVSPAALPPAISLLDQVGEHTVVLATRPGHGYPHDMFGDASIRDQFSLTYLGAEPESPKWLSFCEEVINRFFGERVREVDREALLFFLALTRESVRSALDLVDKYLKARSQGEANPVSWAVQAVKSDQMVSFEEPLRGYQGEFKKMVGRLRK